MRLFISTSLVYFALSMTTVRLALPKEESYGRVMLKEVLSKWSVQLNNQLKDNPKDYSLIQVREDCLVKREFEHCPDLFLTKEQLSPYIKSTYETIIEIRTQLMESL